MRPTFTRSASVSRSVRTSLKKRASTMIIINFMISDTCKLKIPPIEIQRFAPKCVEPMTITTSKPTTPQM